MIRTLSLVALYVVAWFAAAIALPLLAATHVGLLTWLYGPGEIPARACQKADYAIYRRGDTLYGCELKGAK